MADANCEPGVLSADGRKPWESEACPFNQSATGYLGVKRDYMLTNDLLMRARDGKAKRRGFKLPPIDFAYGSDAYRSADTAGQALNGWPSERKLEKVKVPERKRKSKAVKLNPDYLQMNRAGQLLGAQGCIEYNVVKNTRWAPLLREKKMMEMMEKHGDLERPPKKEPSPDRVHGMVYHSENNMMKLMSGAYQVEWLESQRRPRPNRVEPSTKVKKIKMNHKNRGLETTSSILRTHMLPVEDDQPPWRMARFLKVPGHLKTFRSDSALMRAKFEHCFVRHGNKGQNGQGIPRLDFVRRLGNK